MSLSKIVTACVITAGLWWLHHSWWERFAPVAPFEEPFDEPGGGWQW